MPDNDLQKKILEAGVVSKEAVKQMEQWQTVPQGASENVGEVDLDRVRALKQDLGMTGLPSIRETLPDIKKIMEQARLVNLHHSPLKLVDVTAGADRLDRYIFEIPSDPEAYRNLSIILRPMTQLVDVSRDPPDDDRIISAVSLLYKDAVPSHWFCETDAKGKKTIIRGR